MTAATAEPQSGPGCPRPHTEATLASGRGGAEAVDDSPAVIHTSGENNSYKMYKR